MLTIPKRLRAYFIYDRRRLGLLSRVASRTLYAYVGAALGEQDAAASMLAWPHLGFSAYVGPAITAEDRAAVLRVARYGARAPVAESRLRYDAERAEVELASDAVDGPYVGVHRFAAVEFLARLVQHIPGMGEVRARYYGAYASRRRGWWRQHGVVLAGAGQEQAHEEAERGENVVAGRPGGAYARGCAKGNSYLSPSSPMETSDDRSPSQNSGTPRRGLSRPCSGHARL